MSHIAVEVWPILLIGVILLDSSTTLQLFWEKIMRHTNTQGIGFLNFCNLHNRHTLHESLKKNPLPALLPFHYYLTYCYILY